MSKINKVQQKDINELALNSMKKEVARNQSTWNQDLSKGFLNSEILDLQLNHGMQDMYSRIMKDDIFDDMVIRDHLSGVY